LLLIRVARGSLPFEPLIPNATTIKAIEEARRGELINIGTLDDLFIELNADD
jgi:DNA-damage-inducible protein J